MTMKMKRPAKEYSGFVKSFLFAIPCLFVSYCILSKIFAAESYRALIREDGPIEWLQAVLYFCASVLAFVAAVRFAGNRRSVHAALYFVFSIGLFFITMEEISWGQRILGFHPPVFFQKHNVQGEFTIHNLDFIQYHFLIPMYILVGFYGSFAWLVLRRLHPARRETFGWFVPDWFLVPCFLPLFAVYSYFRLGVYAYWHRIAAFPIGGFVIWKDQEPAELLLALGFLFFTASILRRQRSERKNASA
jgi:hypothetical protein